MKRKIIYQFDDFLKECPADAEGSGTKFPNQG